MALHIGCTFEKPLGGVIGLSGFAFAQTQINSHNFDSLKIVLSHGTADGVVPLLIAKMSYGLHNLLEKPNVKFIQIPNLGHGANDTVIKIVADYFRELNQ